MHMNCYFVRINEINVSANFVSFAFGIPLVTLAGGLVLWPMFRLPYMFPVPSKKRRSVIKWCKNCANVVNH